MSALHELVEGLKQEGAVTATDALALRRQIWPDGVIDDAEADLLFAINDAVVKPSPEWVDCFVEAIVEHVVRQARPTGYVDDARAAWLIERVSRDGRVGTPGELELLVRVVERAVNVPERLKRYVLNEIERLVLTGEGPTRDGGRIAPGAVTATEAALLRRVLFAAGGDGPATVSAAEAEMLFRIKDGSLGQDNAPEWKRLFVQGVGNHLMAYSGSRPLERDEAARLEAFMDDREVHVRRFLGRVVRALGDGPPIEDIVRRDHEAAVAEANAVTSAESAWLRSRIERDDVLDPLELALVAFLAEGRS